MGLTNNNLNMTSDKVYEMIKPLRKWWPFFVYKIGFHSDFSYSVVLSPQKTKY